MPAALAIDWDAVKAHAILHGVRPAALAFGLSPNTVLARSAREGWIAPAREALSVRPEAVPETMRRGAIGAIKGSEAAVSSLRKLGDKSRLNLARYVANGAKHAAKLKGAAALVAGPQVKAVADVGKSIHPEWQGASAAPTLRLELIAGAIGDAQGEALPALDVEAEVLPIPDVRG